MILMILLSAILGQALCLEKAIRGIADYGLSVEAAFNKACQGSDNQHHKLAYLSYANIIAKCHDGQQMFFKDPGTDRMAALRKSAIYCGQVNGPAQAAKVTQDAPVPGSRYPTLYDCVNSAYLTRKKTVDASIGAYIKKAFAGTQAIKQIKLNNIYVGVNNVADCRAVDTLSFTVYVVTRKLTVSRMNIVLAKWTPVFYEEDNFNVDLRNDPYFVSVSDSMERVRYGKESKRLMTNYARIFRQIAKCARENVDDPSHVSIVDAGVFSVTPHGGVLYCGRMRTRNRFGALELMEYNAYFYEGECSSFSLLDSD